MSYIYFTIAKNINKSGKIYNNIYHQEKNGKSCVILAIGYGIRNKDIRKFLPNIKEMAE
ncbi:hypothetical protein [Bacteroides acidifaciens]|uniref:hypothetical protein n=1 Tax=Bacteroides acidifaciens TaxID=85831 RepID=UPI00259BD216|nr:hypothetical protein [Bacteroides acidifaciens]